jgi:hypothetical protein
VQELQIGGTTTMRVMEEIAAAGVDQGPMP